MNSLQKDFIERTRSRLKDLSARAAASEILFAEFLRETARTLHTIKGTSQTFGFPASSKLAHELEDLLAAAKKNADSSNLKAMLLEGFGLLIESFEQVNFAEHKIFSDKISPVTVSSSPDQKLFSREIPSEISGRLSDFENKALTSALSEGKEIFCVHASFDLKDFGEEFKKLRESLSLKGEIIATLPGADKKGKIEFVIYLAAENFPEIGKNSSAEIVWQRVNFEDTSDDIFSRIREHAENLAKDSGKEISVEISVDKIELVREKANLIFDILLHLVRNAVDHGIETPEERIEKNKSSDGTIEIACKVEEKGIKISVKDDGSGIDLERLRRIAIEKNLASPEKNLTENELLDLIFLHDFSTAETVTEISGRGVGLDAVKAMTENAGGTIGVKSVNDSGTTFEIFLPKDI